MALFDIFGLFHISCAFVSFTVEDEVHFLLACPLFKEERQKVFEGIHRAFPPTASLNDFNMYTRLMSQEDYNTPKRLGTFCKKSLWKKDAHF